MDTLNTAHLIEAVEASAPPLLASRFKKLVQDRPVITSEEAGGALCAALCSETRYGDLGAKPLIGGAIHLNGETAWLTPEQLMLNPGLGEWSPAFLAQAMMLPVESAYAMTGATMQLPSFDFVGVVVAEGVCAGRFALTFATGAQATLWFGQAADASLFASQTYALSGHGLANVGNTLRHITNAAVLADLDAVEAEGARAH